MALELGPCQVMYGIAVRGTAWAALTNYALGDKRVITDASPAISLLAEVTTDGGSSAASSPDLTGKTVGSTITDDGITWTVLSVGLTDLGKTQGGVTLRISDESVDLKSDQYGTAAEDTIITGTTVEVECSFAEISFELLSKVLHQSTFGAAAGVLGENNVGTSLLADDKELQLIKYVSGAASTDLADRIILPLAAPVGNIELSYDADNQRVMATKFKCFPKSITANWGVGTGATAKTVTYFFGDDTSTS